MANEPKYNDLIDAITGSLLVSDDYRVAVYRVTYRSPS